MNEQQPSQTPGRSSEIRQLIGNETVDSLIAEFGLPQPGTTEYADARGRFAAEDDRNAHIADIRDGFTPQRDEDLKPNDPITEAVIAASNGDPSILDNLGSEEKSVADMLMTAAEDLGQRPGDMATDMTQTPSDLNNQRPTNPQN